MRTTFARWVCNSCNANIETATEKQPKGWLGYGFTAPDIPAGEQVTLGHLCADCAGRVNAALATKPVPMRTDCGPEASR